MQSPHPTLTTNYTSEVIDVAQVSHPRTPGRRDSKLELEKPPSQEQVTVIPRPAGVPVCVQYSRLNKKCSTTAEVNNNFFQNILQIEDIQSHVSFVVKDLKNNFLGAKLAFPEEGSGEMLALAGPMVRRC